MNHFKALDFITRRQVLTSETGHHGVVLWQDQTQHPQSEGINKAATIRVISQSADGSDAYQNDQHLGVCVCVVPMHGVEVKSWSYVKYTLKPKDTMNDILHNTKDSVLCGTTLKDRTSTWLEEYGNNQ
jgi:hypothetical protein